MMKECSLLKRKKIFKSIFSIYTLEKCVTYMYINIYNDPTKSDIMSLLERHFCVNSDKRNITIKSKQRKSKIISRRGWRYIHMCE